MVSIKVDIILCSCLLSAFMSWGQSTKLELIEKKIDSLAAVQDSIYNELFLELKTMGFNDTLKHYERISALTLIGKLRTPESINFMLDTISHYIFTGDYTGDIDIYRANPCFHGLFKYNGRDTENNMYLFPYIMESLKKDVKKDEELILLSQLLEFAIPRSSVLIEYLEYRLRAAYSPQKENLRKIIDIIKRG